MEKLLPKANVSRQHSKDICLLSDGVRVFCYLILTCCVLEDVR